MKPLFLLICPNEVGQAPSPRLENVLNLALQPQAPDAVFTTLAELDSRLHAGFSLPDSQGCPDSTAADTGAATGAFPRGTRLLFAIQLDAGGVNLEFTRFLAALRTRPEFLAGCFGSVIVDGQNDCYTKSIARTLVLAANTAGCTFPGRCLVEGTRSLSNFAIQAANLGCTIQQAYPAAAKALVEHLLCAAVPISPAHPHILVVHASVRATSNTMALWDGIRRRVSAACPAAEFSEINLRSGTLVDCAGCAYKTCRHYGEQSSCFYGGVMTQKVFPALQSADVLVLLCPNYNDSLSANLLAFINRLTALFRVQSFGQKQLFSVVVSGYSGSDLVAEQLLGALNMNKGFFLPAHAILQKTANNEGEALRLPGIEAALDQFADGFISAIASERERNTP